MASAQALIAQQRPKTQVDIFMGKVLTIQDREEIQRALPRHVPFDRFERNLVNAIMNEPKLLNLEPRHVCREAMKIAALGLLIDAQLGEAYLIASRTGPQARIGYRGLLKLARQSGQVAKIYAEKVHANDKVAGKLGTNKFLEHEPDFFGERGDVVGFYAVIVFKDGETDFEAMNVHEVNAIRDRSDGWKAFKAGAIKDTPWNSSYEEMGRKTAIRRLLKRSPQSPDLVQAFQVEDEADHPEIAASQPMRALPVRNPLADEDDGGPTIDQQSDQTDQRDHNEHVDAETGEVIRADGKSVAEVVKDIHERFPQTMDRLAESERQEAKSAEKAAADQEQPAASQAQSRDQAAPAADGAAAPRRGRPPKAAQVDKSAPVSAAVDTVSVQQATAPDTSNEKASELSVFKSGCQSASNRGALEALRDRHRGWFTQLPTTGDEFKSAEAAYTAAVTRLDDQERAKSEEEAHEDPETATAAPNDATGAEGGSSAAAPIGEGSAGAEVRQISSGGDRGPAAVETGGPAQAGARAPESWEDLLPDGDFADRELKSLRNCAKELFNAKSMTEVRDVDDGYREMMNLRSQPCKDAFASMLEARREFIRNQFKPGD